VFAEKNLLLDLGDTLVSIDDSFDSYTKVAITNVLSKFGFIDNKDIIDGFIELRNSIRKEAHQSLKETHIRSFLNTGFMKILHLQLNDNELEELEKIYIQAELNITETFPDSLAFLNLALRSDKKIYIVTNNFSPLHVSFLVEKFDMQKYLSGIYISGSCGYRKPHEQFLKGFFEKFEIDPYNSVILGDKYEMDVVAGKNVGIKTCLLNRNNSIIHMSKGPPDYIFRSLSEIKFP